MSFLVFLKDLCLTHNQSRLTHHYSYLRSQPLFNPGGNESIWLYQSLLGTLERALWYQNSINIVMNSNMYALNNATPAVYVTHYL